MELDTYVTALRYVAVILFCLVLALTGHMDALTAIGIAIGLLFPTANITGNRVVRNEPQTRR